MFLWKYIRLVYNVRELTLGNKLIISLSFILTFIGYCVYSYRITYANFRSFLIPTLFKKIHFIKFLILLIWSTYLGSVPEADLNAIRTIFIVTVIIDLYTLFNISCEILQVFLEPYSDKCLRKNIKVLFTLNTIIFIFAVLSGCLIFNPLFIEYSSKLFISFVLSTAIAILSYSNLAKVCEHEYYSE